MVGDPGRTEPIGQRECEGSGDEGHQRMADGMQCGREKKAQEARGAAQYPPQVSYVEARDGSRRHGVSSLHTPMRDHSRLGHLSYIPGLRAPIDDAQNRTPSPAREQHRPAPHGDGLARPHACPLLEGYERCITIGSRIELFESCPCRTESIEALGFFVFSSGFPYIERFRPNRPPARERGSIGHEQKQEQRGRGRRP